MDNTSPNKRIPIDIIAAEDLERIANPLVVVHGYTQLLQRRLRRGLTVETEELLRILGLIEEASQSAKAGVATLVVRAHSLDSYPHPEE